MNESQGQQTKTLSSVQNTLKIHFIYSTTALLKDTVDDAASLDVSILGKVQLDELPEATGVIVVHGLCVAKSFHDGAADKRQAMK